MSGNILRRSNPIYKATKAIERLQKEIDKLQAENKRLERNFESLSIRFSALYECENKLRAENKRLRGEKTVIKCENCGGASKLAELHAEERTNHWHTQQENKRLRGALEEISEPKGAYSEDRLEHAENTIKNLVEIAQKALEVK